jgi:hypothetical protein
MYTRGTTDRYSSISVFLSGSISESVLEIRNPLTLEDRPVEFLIREPEFGVLDTISLRVERQREGFQLRDLILIQSLVDLQIHLISSQTFANSN